MGTARRWGRFAATTLVGVALGCTVLTPAADGAEAAPAQVGGPTFTAATADLIRINPAIGNTPLTIWIGESLAGHQNVGAYSEARWLDLGFIGDVLGGEGCDGGDGLIPPGTLPEPISATSTGPDGGETQTGGLEQLIDASVQADSSPSSTASVDVLPLDLSGLLTVTGSRSEASSSEGGTVSRAVSDIAAIELLGGLIRLEGLRWEAERRLTPEPVTTSDFSIGRLVVAGVPVPLPLDDLVGTAVGAISPVLTPLGVELAFPEVVEFEDGIELTPLTVGIVPGELRSSVLGPILGLVQEPYNSFSEMLIDFDCGNATYVTVLDIVLGTLSGAGYTTVDLGGVAVEAGELETSSFLQPIPAGRPSAPVAAPSSGGTGTTAVRTPTTAAPTTSGATTTVTEPELEVAVAVDGPAGERGGPLVAVGGVGFALASVAALADRRRMRLGQRSGPLPPV